MVSGAIFLGGCAQISPSGGPPAAYGIEAFSQALTMAGATVLKGDGFVADPLAGQGVNLCVDGQQVAVYSFATSADRLQGQARIDPTDPWHIGNSQVEWFGNPRFWARDLIIVRYNGPDPDVVTRIKATLGAPFVVGAQNSVGFQGQVFSC
jgi:hypothetical protein